MHLKRLDVIGFKSFAERIGVDFVPGVTAVVGPNGSGKSNITDAIRWVLGEQSAKSLRGAKMEDIIFAGSDTRKPLNFAEVTLTLENEDQFLPIDYHEVSVTRRVFRSGESEFLINKQNCRLKDIIDLFMDSGLGREAFSIISQGRVEEILNSKAEDRRSIFEEAAGVLKYKTRKKKAEGKLTETEENLNRVKDILHELEGQVEPLKIQASIAKDYLKQKEELESIEVALTVFEIEELHQKWQALSGQLQQNKALELELSTGLQTKEAKMIEMRENVAVLDESINDLQNVLLHASEELEKLEGKKQVLKERKKNAKQNKEQLEKNIVMMEEKILLLTEQKNVQQLKLQSITEEVAQFNESLKEKQELVQMFSENVELKIESLKSDYIEVLNQQATYHNEWKNVDLQIEQQIRRNDALQDDNKKFIDERQVIEKKRERILLELQEIQHELDEQVHLFRREQQKLETLRMQYDKQESTLYQAYQYLQKAQSRRDMLEEMEDDYSGFYQGVKEILKSRGNKLSGILGAVAELVEVPKKYQQAIEIALGAAMQHVIVEKEESGRAAIQYLKQHGLGRATFLPLNVIKGKTLSAQQIQSVKGHPAFVGIASELISYEMKYVDIFSNLLGNVIIAIDLKGANEMAKILQYRCRIVTLDGDVVNAGGSMTGGGSKQKQSSLLTRKGELEDLKEKLQEMEVQTLAQENKVKKLKSDSQKQEELLEAFRKKGEDLRIREQSIKGDLREVELEEKSMNEKLALYDLNIAQFTDEQTKLNNRKLELEQLLEETSTSIATLDENIQNLTLQKNTQASSKETLSDEMNELRIKLSALNEQKRHGEETLTLTINELTENMQQLTNYKEDFQLLSSEMSSSSSGEITLEEATIQKQEDKNTTIELIASRREERLSLHHLIEDLELELKELKRQQRGLNGVLKDDEIKLNRIDVELENRLDHLREEYLLSYEGAKEDYSLSIPVEEARRKVKLIKLSIEELGAVNLGAIDEYERVSERYEFLLEQRNDLEEAKDTLFQVIDEMDEEMKKRFEETFYGIRSHFEGVFQALFGGGRADLSLTDPADLLNTGVEIVAQPPGKKLQNLGLLSGGERALTAIALLFSILKIRPVPFCILDEVEAALDEANVFRFSQYLKRYSDETQFIVITHRKGTMEGADVLYGITMQESGVSKLVSVRLEESKELVEM